MSQEHVQAALASDELLERLAALEHERWAHWQGYVHEQCTPQTDGSLVIPAGLAERWQMQAQTPYDELTEKERDSDREQVLRYLPTIMRAVDEAQRRNE